jgi:hypothetical protein
MAIDIPKRKAPDADILNLAQSAFLSHQSSKCTFLSSETFLLPPFI